MSSKRRSKRSPSPMEQGELDEESPVDLTSPELRLEAEDSHLSGEDEDDGRGRSRSSEDEHERRSGSPDRSEDDTLDIKPPQASGKRDKHKKKHKDERRRDREQREQTSRESDRAKHSLKEEKERRDRGRDRPDREEFRQKEERRRMKSLKESGDFSSVNTRERLERLERERHRIDRDRQKREQEHREQLRKQQEREKARERERDRQERADRVEKDRRKEEEVKRRRERQKPPVDERQSRREKDKPRQEPRGDERIVQRSRSPHERERRDKDRDRYREREKERQVHQEQRFDERQRRPRRDSPSREGRDGPPPKEKGPQRRVEYAPEDDAAPVAPSRGAGGAQREPEQYVEEEESASDAGESAVGSDVRSASPGSAESRSESDASESESGSDSERDRRPVEGEEREERTPDYKRRSKFDDPESEKESETESAHLSNEENEEEYMEQTPPASPVELKPILPPYLPAIQGCRSVDEFQCLNRIEEGTYGVVYRAKDKKIGETVALKKLKMEKEKEGFPITSLREINTLLKAQHVNIVTVREIVVGSNMDKIFIVMDFVEHDLKSLMETMKEPFITGEVKTLMIQLLRGVAHLHDNWIVHRDLKTSNLLLSHEGILKIGDFGLAREYGSPLKQYTPIVVTLWYRAPELLLGTKMYNTAIDLWSCGCIFAEFLTRKPLFPGKSEIDQLNKIFTDLGTPNEKIWPGVSELPAMKKCTFADHPYNKIRERFGHLITEKGFDLMNRFLTYNPAKRITAEGALKHDYFSESPLPVDPSMFPTWPAKSEQPRRTRGNSPKPPSGGKAYAKLLGDDDEHVARSSGGFHLATATKGASAAGAGFALKFGP